MSVSELIQIHNSALRPRVDIMDVYSRLSRQFELMAERIKINRAPLKKNIEETKFLFEIQK
jgi:hypothetical protein